MLLRITQAVCIIVYASTALKIKCMKIRDAWLFFLIYDNFFSLKLLHVLTKSHFLHFFLMVWSKLFILLYTEPAFSTKPKRITTMPFFQLPPHNGQ